MVGLRGNVLKFNLTPIKRAPGFLITTLLISEYKKTGTISLL
jgi:hypothetical protein